MYRLYSVHALIGKKNHSFITQSIKINNNVLKFLSCCITVYKIVADITCTLIGQFKFIITR